MKTFSFTDFLEDHFPISVEDANVFSGFHEHFLRKVFLDALFFCINMNLFFISERGRKKELQSRIINKYFYS